MHSPPPEKKNNGLVDISLSRRDSYSVNIALILTLAFVAYAPIIQHSHSDILICQSCNTGCDASDGA